MPGQTITTRGGTAVMQSRRSTQASLDLFPTPPWATRALFPYIHGGEVVWEPAAGLGHMAEVLAERFNIVYASDVHDHGYQPDLALWHGIGSFVGEGLDVLDPPPADWIITNPPFKLAEEFAHRALSIARVGVALLVRIAWLEGEDRYRNLFAARPPQTIAVFCERVPMVQGRWDPEAASATCYAWVIWRQPIGFQGPACFTWIEPGRRAALTRPDDVKRFARAMTRRPDTEPMLPLDFRQPGRRKWRETAQFYAAVRFLRTTGLNVYRQGDQHTVDGAIASGRQVRAIARARGFL